MCVFLVMIKLKIVQAIQHWYNERISTTTTSFYRTGGCPVHTYCAKLGGIWTRLLAQVIYNSTCQRSHTLIGCWLPACLSRSHPLPLPSSEPSSPAISHYSPSSHRTSGHWSSSLSISGFWSPFPSLSLLGPPAPLLPFLVTQYITVHHT